MMNRDRTAGIHLLKFAVVLPLIVMLAVAFGQTSGKHSIKKADGEQYNLSSLTYRINERVWKPSSKKINGIACSNLALR